MLSLVLFLMTKVMNQTQIMKNLLTAALIMITFSSCCLVSSRECFCSPPKSFIDPNAIEWHEPKENESLLFVNQSNDSLIVEKDFYQGAGCVGGDECCADFPNYNSTWRHTFGSIELLNLYSLMNSVTFRSKSDGYPTDVFIYEINPSSYTTNASDDYEVVVSDTVLNNIEQKKLLILRKGSGTATFNRLVFVKSIGIIEFTDTQNDIWKRR